MRKFILHIIILISIIKVQGQNDTNTVLNDAIALQKHSNLVQQEQEIFKGLNDKYGDGNYDPTSNTFIPSETKEEKSISKESKK